MRKEDKRPRGCLVVNLLAGLGWVRKGASPAWQGTGDRPHEFWYKSCCVPVTKSYSPSEEKKGCS